MARAPGVGASGVRFRGLDELLRDLRRFDASVQREIGPVMKAGATAVLPVVIAAVPKRTGQLAGSIRPFGTAKTAGVRSSLIYAGPVEFGGWPRGRPMVRGGRHIVPAFKRGARLAEPIIEVGLSALIRKAGL